jgi:hypothetical protein
VTWLPASVKTAATRLAKVEWASLNQFIAVAVAEMVGVLERRRQEVANRLEWRHVQLASSPPCEKRSCRFDHRAVAVGMFRLRHEL